MKKTIEVVRKSLPLAVLLWVPAAGARAGLVLSDGPISRFEAPAGLPELEAAGRVFASGKADDALKGLGAACKAHPELPPARFLLGLMFLADGRAPQGRALLEQAAAESPDHPDVHVAFGKLALIDGRLADARLQFRAAAGRVAAGGPWTEDHRREVRRLCGEGLAVVAESRQDWASAREHLTAWLEIDPANGTARARLARAMFAAGEADPAYKEWQRAGRDDPKLEPAAVAMARLYTGKGDLKKAGEWMEFAVKSAPNDARVHAARAGWLLDRGEGDRARDEVDTAARLDGGSAAIRRLRGTVARYRHDYAAAERDFQALVQDSPGDLGAADQLALVLADQADEPRRRRALELAERNARQAPDSPEVLATLGWALFRAGRAEDAERALRSAFKSGQASAAAAYFLGRVLADRGQVEEARKLLRAALDASTDAFLYRADAQKELAKLGS